MDLSVAFYSALSADATVTGYLATYQSYPCIFTKVPVPSAAPYPMLVVMPPASVQDFDFLTTKNLMVNQDLIVYGEQDSDYRNVETLAWYLRTLFARNKNAVTITGWNVLAIQMEGPVPAPISDEQHIARRVGLTLSLSEN